MGSATRRRHAGSTRRPRRSANGLAVSVQGACLACRIDRPGRFHRQTKRPPPHAPPSRLCGGNATPATVSRVLRRLGLNKLSALEPVEPVRRYEREHPGELIHIDIKKLGRFDGVGHRITGDRTGQSNRRARGEGLGWEFVHVSIDDNSRVAFVQVMPNEKKESAVAFLKNAVAYYESLGIKVERVMTDNGACYRALDFRDACRDVGMRHLRTKPYTPKTNGKAERFIQTALREWAYAKAYTHSDHRTAELPIWLHRYNWHRPHAGIKAKTPISRLGLSEDNVLRLHI
jgi:transposase InsO family protein